MKKKKWILFGVITALLLIQLIFLSEYRFPNRQETIVSIRLMEIRDEKSGDPQDYVLIRELGQDEYDPFMDAIYAMDMERVGTPPRWGYGEHIACVTYANGETEVFGTFCLARIPSGEDWSGVGEYYFTDADAIDLLIRQYAGKS